MQKALKHMFENRSEGDLLMDVPQNWTWTELIKVAGNRDVWRDRVTALRKGSGVQVTMNNSLPGCRAPRRSARLAPTTAANTSKPNTSKTTASPRARRYIARDRHEAFFRPGLAMRGKRKRTQRQPGPKKKKKSPMWTNKQRAAWAREHYKIHHGPDLTLDTTALPMDWSHHTIHGHHQSPHDLDLDETALPPMALEDMFAYFEDKEENQQNLQNFSMLISEKSKNK